MGKGVRQLWIGKAALVRCIGAADHQPREPLRPPLLPNCSIKRRFSSALRFSIALACSSWSAASA